MSPELAHRTNQLTIDKLKSITPEQAEKTAIELLSQQASLRNKGLILVWSRFNENPDLLVNTLLAKIIVDQIDPSVFAGITANRIAVLSIENSASHLAIEISHAIAQKNRYDTLPRMIRARKTDKPGAFPSPAMGEISASASVIPFTSNGVPKHLIASCSLVDKDEFSQKEILFTVDDFLATRKTISAGIDIGSSLLMQTGANMDNLLIIPVAGLGKPKQATDISFNTHGAKLYDIITALDVNFWPDRELNRVLVQANGHEPLVLEHATIEDFS